MSNTNHSNTRTPRTLSSEQLGTVIGGLLIPHPPIPRRIGVAVANAICKDDRCRSLCAQ